MIFISWNFQGLVSTLTRRSLKDLDRKFKSHVIFLCETRNKKEKGDRMRKQMRFEGVEYVEPAGKGGGISLWWKGCQVRV